MRFPSLLPARLKPVAFRFSLPPNMTTRNRRRRSLLLERFRLGDAKTLAEIYKAHGAVSDTKPTTIPNDMMWWDNEHVEATVNRAFVESHLRADEALRLDETLKFGDSLTDDTYFEWIEAKAKRIFLILVDIGVPDQIFGAVDDSWDDDDLPISLDQVERLQLTRKRDEILDRMFFERQFTYLMRHLKPDENLIYEDTEMVPLEPVYDRPNGAPVSLAQCNVDKVCIPGRPNDIFIRRQLPLGDGPGQITQADFLSGIERMRAQSNQHIASLWTSYVHKSIGYLLLTPIHEESLASVLTTLPHSIKIMAKRDRRVLLLDWMHCLADATAFLHNQGLHHGQIKPSNIFIDIDNKVFLSDVGIFDLDQAKQFDKEDYDYSSPELSNLMNTRSFLNHKHGGSGTVVVPSPNETPALSFSTATTSSPFQTDSMFSTSFYLPRQTTPPSSASDPIKNDIYSLGCIYLELLTIIMKRSSRSFCSHRAANNKSVRRGSDAPDSSFYKNAGQVETWASGLVKEARKKEDRLFRGISHLVNLSLRMLSPHPTDRPSARFCEERVYEILINNSGVKTTHCGSARLWRIADGMVDVVNSMASLTSGSRNTAEGSSDGSPNQRQRDYLGSRGSASVTHSGSGSEKKSSDAGSIGRYHGEVPKARPWKAPVYPEFRFG